MELASLRLIGEHDGPHVLITGGIHGDEFEPMAAIRRLGDTLRYRALRGRVTLVPVVNEAAFRLARRNADDGLDLARTCPGRPDGSITERTAHALARMIATADAYIDLHNGGSALAIYPMAGYMLHPDPNVLARQRRMARSFGMPVVWGTDPNLEGRSLSVARDARIPAIYVEYLGGGYDRRNVEPLLRGCLNILGDLDVINGENPPRAVEPIVIEDARPSTGHLQIQHPSPRDGFFESSAELGQRIERGGTLGRVVDLLGPEIDLIRSDRDGFLLALRVLPRVERGDCLAVVIETNPTPPSWSLAPALARRDALRDVP